MATNSDFSMAFSQLSRNASMSCSKSRYSINILNMRPSNAEAKSVFFGKWWLIPVRDTPVCWLRVV
ncbi:Uncharacterised protein [Vibrio cholerae]|nr:Uncharacterised protein [Vibrio cholerae]